MALQHYGVVVKIKIKNIATVQMGYSFRTRFEASSTGIPVIQMKDLNSDNTVNCHNLAKANIGNSDDRNFVKKGDLIFRTRGQNISSAVIVDEPGLAIVAAPLLIIRVKNLHILLPEYLNWYISQRDAQIFLAKANQTTQKMISRKDIEEMEVAIPSLEKQKNIVELASLSAQEQKLLTDLAEKRKQLTSKILMQFVTGE